MKPAPGVMNHPLPRLSLILLGFFSACGSDTTDVDEDGYSPPADCDDANGEVHPASTEACNGIDDNCDGAVDEGIATDAVVWYGDADGDTFGAPGPTLVACTAPAGWVANADDCDDTQPEVHPEASEVCGNGIDDDCDGAPGACRRTGRMSAAEADVVLIGPWLTSAGFMVRLGDIAGDAAQEVLIGEPGVYDGGCASAVWGAVWPFGADRMPIADLPLRVCDEENQGVGTDIGVGDLDGDGQEDLLIGMPNAAISDPNEGAIGLWYGPMAVGDTAWWTADSRLQGGAGAYLYGTGVAVGDFDADGQDDVVAAAYADHTSLTSAGAVYAFRGPVARWIYRDRAEADVTIHGDTTNQYFGARIHTLPDIDQDGDDELVVAGPHEDAGGLTDAGVVRVYTDILGGDSTVADADFAVNGTSVSEGLGWVSDAGDINGDGLGDLVIGTPDGGDDSGVVLVWFGPMAGVEDAVPAVADFSILGTDPYGHLGHAVGVDDVDGDGQVDLLVGTLALDAGITDEGYLLVFYGPLSRGSVGAGDADLVIEGVEPGGRFGYGEPHAGDVDGDGVPDLVVAAPMADMLGLNSDSGAVYVFRGLGL